jgi:hypothetical protein
MKSAASRLMKTTICSLIAGLFLLVTSGAVFAQMDMKGVLKEGAKEGAMEMLGVKKPVQGQAEMMDGAKMMMDGKKTLKNDLVKSDKVKEGVPLEGEMKLSEGYEAMVDGDKMIQAQKIPEGKKKMMDGASMMENARKNMMADLSKKGLIKADKPSEGEVMMKDGEKKMKDGETMMLK